MRADLHVRLSASSPDRSEELCQAEQRSSVTSDIAACGIPRREPSQTRAASSALRLASCILSIHEATAWRWRITT